MRRSEREGEHLELPVKPVSGTVRQLRDQIGTPARRRARRSFFRTPLGWLIVGGATAAAMVTISGLIIFEPHEFFQGLTSEIVGVFLGGSVVAALFDGVGRYHRRQVWRRVSSVVLQSLNSRLSDALYGWIPQHFSDVASTPTGDVAWHSVDMAEATAYWLEKIDWEHYLQFAEGDEMWVDLLRTLIEQAPTAFDEIDHALDSALTRAAHTGEDELLMELLVECEDHVFHARSQVLPTANDSGSPSDLLAGASWTPEVLWLVAAIQRYCLIQTDFPRHHATPAWWKMHDW